MTPRYGGTGLRLVGSGLVLREWDRGDLAVMVELFDDPDIAYRTPLPSPFDSAVAQAYLDRARSDDGRIQLAITTDGERPLGEVLLSRQAGSLGYAVGAAHRGQRLAVRAVQLLTAYAHDVENIPRVVLEIEPDNAASSAVARGAGYRLTDRRPSPVADKGRSYTLLTWEHLAGSPPEV
jgi:RimJ/RimL family protein N-acetyltransferase